jgi:hypothetical protein
LGVIFQLPLAHQQEGHRLSEANASCKGDGRPLPLSLPPLQETLVQLATNRQVDARRIKGETELA